jgi:hypothetical protein
MNHSKEDHLEIKKEKKKKEVMGTQKVKHHQEDEDGFADLGRRRQLRHSEASFADHMSKAAICPLMCGDTPTSRRTYDAYIAGCVPLFVGTRLWGRCDKPCQ